MKSKIIAQKVPVTFYFLLLASLFFLIHINNAWSGEDKVNHATLKVEGMTCASCAPIVKMVLKKLDGVVMADVSADEGKAEVDYQEGKVTVDKMIKTINDIGFKASLSKKRRK